MWLIVIQSGTIYQEIEVSADKAHDLWEFLLGKLDRNFQLLVQLYNDEGWLEEESHAF